MRATAAHSVRYTAHGSRKETINRSNERAFYNRTHTNQLNGACIGSKGAKNSIDCVKFVVGFRKIAFLSKFDNL